MGFLNDFLLCFIPLLVAIDAPATLPFFTAMTEEMGNETRAAIVRLSILTAFLVTVGFVLVGRAVFDTLGILVEDFMIAGGIVLLIIATVDIVRASEKQAPPGPTFGAVPLGTPLIAGPAVLTTSLVLQSSYGYLPVLVSLIANLLIAWFIFAQSERIIKVAGTGGTRAFAKVASLILAAFAVKMIRNGITRLAGM